MLQRFQPTPPWRQIFTSVPSLLYSFAFYTCECIILWQGTRHCWCLARLCVVHRLCEPSAHWLVIKWICCWHCYLCVGRGRGVWSIHGSTFPTFRHTDVTGSTHRSTHTRTYPPTRFLCLQSVLSFSFVTASLCLSFICPECLTDTVRASQHVTALTLNAHTSIIPADCLRVENKPL